MAGLEPKRNHYPHFCMPKRSFVLFLFAAAGLSGCASDSRHAGDVEANISIASVAFDETINVGHTVTPKPIDGEVIRLQKVDTKGKRALFSFRRSGSPSREVWVKVGETLPESLTFGRSGATLSTVNDRSVGLQVRSAERLGSSR